MSVHCLTHKMVLLARDVPWRLWPRSQPGNAPLGCVILIVILPELCLLPGLCKGQPEVCTPRLMGARSLRLLLRWLRNSVPLQLSRSVPPSFPFSRASSLFLCLANDSEELDWWMIYIKKKKKHTHFFFFFELGSRRALRAAWYRSTPTCSTAGKQASEGFNGISPEAVLLRCRLFLLPLQLTPFTVSCPLLFPPPLPLPPQQCTKLLASFSAHGSGWANWEKEPYWARWTRHRGEKPLCYT